MKNYSRQREAIKNVLQSTDTHPTANWVYEEVRKTIPNISLGTVYRNLSALAESGEILSLTVGDGFEHYDADNSPHLHLHCKECGKIYDAVLEKDYIADMAKKSDFISEISIYVAYGICKNCNTKMKTI